MVTQADLEDFLGDVLRRRSANTAATRYKVLRVLWRWLEKEELPNPMARLRDRAGRDRRCERRIRGMPRKARARRHAGRTSSAPQRSFVGCTGEAMGFSLPHSAADEFVAPGRLSS
jgi:hypothetical protein